MPSTSKKKNYNYALNFEKKNYNYALNFKKKKKNYALNFEKVEGDRAYCFSFVHHIFVAPKMYEGWIIGSWNVIHGFLNWPVFF